MNRVLKFLFVLCILMLAFLCASAGAAPANCPYDIHLSIMYNYLTESQRILYDRMYDALWDGWSTVRVPEDMPRSEAEWMIDYIYNEAPELCAYDRWATKVVNSAGNRLEIHFAYKFPLSVQKDFIERVAFDAQGYAGFGDRDGIRSVCEAIVRRFEYGKIPGEDTQLAYFALKNNTAVCNGYAQTTAMYCHFAGYPASYIDGHAFNTKGEDLGGHAWNVVCIDGEYMWFDLTWADEGDEIDREWYGLSAMGMLYLHKPDPEYKPLLDKESILPEGVTFTMHLDVNGEDGFDHGVTQEQHTTVKISDLGSGEYYTPALVIWNDSNSPVRVVVSYVMDDKTIGWKEREIMPGKNGAFRTNASQLKNQTGSKEIVWYCGGMRLGSFFWHVK